MKYKTQLMKLIYSVLFLALMVACSRSPSSPMSMRLTISPEPIVAREVKLQVELTSLQDAPETMVTITLPSGIELLEGELIQQIALKANELSVINLKVRVATAGEWQIYAYAFYQFSPDSTAGVGDSKTIYIIASKDSAKVLNESERNKTPIPVIQDNLPTLIP